MAVGSRPGRGPRWERERHVGHDFGAWRETEEHHADAGEDGQDEGSESTNEKEDCESDDELGEAESP